MIKQNSPYQNNLYTDCSFLFSKNGGKPMQTILIVIITVLILVAGYQARQIRKLEEKTLDAFRIVCSRFKREEK